MKKIAAVDLFCGAGGLTHGLIQSKINVVAGFDIDGACKYPYEKNNKGALFFRKNVKDISSDEINDLFPSNHIRLLAGCAPCQPFSKYSQGRDVKSDKKWPLLYEFARLITHVSPELVTMENVPEVTRHQVYIDFVRSLKSQGYLVWADTIFCPEYGLPQNRKRHVLLASKVGQINMIKPTKTKGNFKTVKDAIGNNSLPPLESGQSDPKDVLHSSSRLSPINLSRIKHSKPGGTWEDWPKDLLAACHTRKSGKSYKSVYGRMAWQEPSPTMTTQCYGFGNGRFGHPEQNRAITLREAAILQSFPKNYKFVKSKEDFNRRKVGTMIGNAVPVTLGKVIGKSFYNSLQE